MTEALLRLWRALVIFLPSSASTILTQAWRGTEDQKRSAIYSLTRRGSPVDDRPSTDKLPHFVKKISERFDQQQNKLKIGFPIVFSNLAQKGLGVFSH